ncbi:MAG: hypothetical protein WD397_10045 [Wenzhouxiangellaceae bacterium]
MKRFIPVALCALAAIATAGFEQEPRARLVSVSEHDYVELTAAAKQRVATMAGRGEAPATVINAIRAVPDSLAREAQWSAWLDSLKAAHLLDPVEIETLETLAGHSAQVGIPHHEFPSRTVPAFQVANRAQVLMARDTARRRAVELADSPEQLTAALDDGPGSQEFATGLLALEIASSATLSEVVSRYRFGQPAQAGDAQVVLKVAKTDAAFMYLLPEIIEFGDVASARNAIRVAVDGRVAMLPEVAAKALDRPELGGLALTAAQRAGMHPDRFCWGLLDNPSLGADAARLLAAHSAELIDEVRHRVESASRPARMRMLLALKLRDSEEARELLAELAGASWLTDQQRREVRAWL